MGADATWSSVNKLLSRREIESKVQCIHTLCGTVTYYTEMSKFSLDPLNMTLGEHRLCVNYLHVTSHKLVTFFRHCYCTAHDWHKMDGQISHSRHAFLISEHHTQCKIATC